MGTQEDTFDRLNIKANRAKKHIDDLSDAIDIFMASDPYKVTSDDDAKEGKRTYHIHFLKPIPVTFSAIIGDAIQNLRSALDHVAYHLVDIGSPGSHVGHVYFPIFPSSEDYETGKMGKIQGASPAAIEVIDSHQPYARGDGWALWDMHTMNNRDKHRLLIPIWGSVVGHSFTVTERARLSLILKERFPGGIPRGYLASPSEPVYLKDGGKLLTIPIEEVDDHMDFRISIAFGEPEQVRGKEVISTLMNMHRIVLKIIVDLSRRGLL